MLVSSSSGVTNPMFHNYCLNESSMKYNIVEFKYYKDRGLLPDCCQTAGNSAFNFTARTKKSLYSLLKDQNLPAWVWEWASKIQRATALIKYPVKDHFSVVRADGYSKLEVSSLVAAGSKLHNFHVKCHSGARSNSRQLVCHLFSIYKYCPVGADAHGLVPLQGLVAVALLRAHAQAVPPVRLPHGLNPEC